MRGRKTYYKNKKQMSIKATSEINQGFNDDTPIINPRQGLNAVLDKIVKPESNSRMIYFIYFPDLSHGDHIVCKIGYAIDLQKRLASIRSSYKQKIVLIEAIQVRSLIDETAFHKKCRKRFPELVYGQIVNKSFRRELYLFHPSLYNFYSVFCSNFLNSIVQTLDF